MRTSRTIFVYGTLKTGYRLNRVLSEGGAKLLGAAVTVEKFTMLAAGFPVVVRSPALARIAGEAWEVPEELMERLDQIEGAYTRERVSVLIGLHAVDAEMYVGRSEVWSGRRMARHVPVGGVLDWPHGRPDYEQEEIA